MELIFLDLLSYRFFVHALAAAVLTSILCGMIGTYIVSKRMVFISGGITHTSFGGIGIGYFLGIQPMIGAAVFSLLSAVGIEYFSRKGDIRHDSMIAIFWALGMAVGITFIYLTPGYAPNLMSYLFGSILTISTAELIALLGVTLLTGVIFSVFYRPILYVAFDEEFARTRMIPVQLIKYLMISLIALTIVFSIRIVGIILVISLLTIPQTAANLLTRRFDRIILYSILLALSGTIGGLILSYYLNIPSGATIIFCLVVIFLTVRLTKKR
ncbi:MAG TPA: metal ABC transporter permease [Bacteroidales bacterium]|nr:metal ABC transporter permease [Bacteroidales bacterium]HNS46925.1 metal ABC transporter permease [Bacteroidales bacterium]